MDKVELEMKIDTLGIEYRKLNDQVIKKRGELNELNERKEVAIRATDEEKTKFTTIVNEISSERLAWHQEKAREEAELESKKDKVASILAKEELLNKKEADLSDEKNKIEDIVKRESEVLQAIKQEKMNNEAILRKAEDTMKEAVVKGEQNKKDKAEFIQKVKDLFNKLITELK